MLRTGGYVIDFWGAGFDIAERMESVAGNRSSKGYKVREVRVVDQSAGKKWLVSPLKHFSG